jgi:hypothetical protein
MRQQDYAAELPEAGLRHSQPFRRQRFETLVQYVCWICEDPRMLGLDRLNRILWYVDRNLYLTRGRVATGASYARHRTGPWARPMEAVLRELERRGLVVQRARVGDREPDLLLALVKPELAGFEPEEISLVEAVTRAICFDSRSSIPHREAHDAILQAARPGEVVPYFTVLSGRPGETTAADLAWAIRESEQRRRRPAEPQDAAPAPRLREATEGLFWHLLRDPGLGTSLPAAASTSWFVYRQVAVAGSGAPDLTALYRFDADEMILGGLRIGGGEDEDDPTADEPS